MQGMFEIEKSGRDIIFNVVHEDFPFVTVGTSSELKIPNTSWELKDEETLPWKNEYDGFLVLVRKDVDFGTLSLFDGKSQDPTKLLLRLSLEKKNNRCSAVDLLEVGKNLHAVVYRPVVGGDCVILAIGRLTSNLSRDEVLKSLPDWNSPYYECPLLLECEISCGEDGEMKKVKY